MRLLIAGIAALAAVSFAAPSFAQEATDTAPAATPAPTPAVKHSKPGTSAYCNSLKSSSQRSSCLKRIQTANVTKHPATKTKKPAAAAATATSADSSAPAPAQMSAPSTGSSVAVPPLPQKTI